MTSVTSSTTGAAGFSYAGSTAATTQSTLTASTSSTSSIASSSLASASVSGGAVSGGGGSSSSSSGSSSQVESETTTTNADGSKTVVIKYTDGTETTQRIPADPATKAQMAALKGQSQARESGAQDTASNDSAITSFKATV